MESKLSLQFYEDFNSGALTIIDRSLYNEDIAVSCERLLITLPGFKHPITIENVVAGFNTAFNAQDFKLVNYATCNCGMMDLVDGLYIINYSICPNDDIYVEYNYLRQTKTYKKLFKKLCSLQLLGCESGIKTNDLIKKLERIEFYLRAAKAYVEECNAPQRGLELQNYANELLDKIDTNCNCN